MKHTSRITTVRLSVLAVLVLIAGLVVGRALTPTLPGAAAQDQPRDLVTNPENLKYLGLSFTPLAITDARAKAAIPSDQAIKSVLSDSPGLKAATQIHPRFGFLQQAGDSQGPVQTDLANGSLVWIVTFQGIETASSGPPGAPRYISHEYNVVVDANTGKYLMAFPLFDVTPVPLPVQSAPMPANPNGSAPSGAPPVIAPTEPATP